MLGLCSDPGAGNWGWGGHSVPSFHSLSPGPVWGWILTFPGAPMASVLSTRNPAAAPSPTAASTAAPTTPPLFSAQRAPPPRRAAEQPAHARTPPAGPLSQQKPFPPGPLCACDSASGWAGWGAFSPSRQIPLTVPHLRLRAPDRRRGHSHPVLRFQPIHHIPSVPPLLHNASQPCPPPCL